MNYAEILESLFGVEVDTLVAVDAITEDVDTPEGLALEAATIALAEHADSPVMMAKLIGSSGFSILGGSRAVHFGPTGIEVAKIIDDKRKDSGLTEFGAGGGGMGRAATKARDEKDARSRAISGRESYGKAKGQWWVGTPKQLRDQGVTTILGEGYVDEADRTLTLKNAKVGLKIENKKNLGWGVFTLKKDRNGWIAYRGSGGDERMLDTAEFKFWMLLANQKERTGRVRESALDEAFTLSPADKRVIDAFTDKKELATKRLTSTGTQLDINGMGGNKIAFWKGNKIHMGDDSGGRSGDVVQRAVRKSAPKNDLAEAAIPLFGQSKLKPGSDATKLQQEIANAVNRDVQGHMFKLGFRVIIGSGSVHIYFAADPKSTPDTNVAFLNDRAGVEVSIDDFTPEGDYSTVNNFGTHSEWNGKLQATSVRRHFKLKTKFRKKTGTPAQVVKHVANYIKAVAAEAKASGPGESIDEAKLKTGIPDVPEIGFERGTFYYTTKSGLRNSVAIPPAKRKDRSYAETKFRMKLRNEANVPNAQALIDKLLKMMDESIDEAEALPPQAYGVMDGERILYLTNRGEAAKRFAKFIDLGVGRDKMPGATKRPQVVKNPPGWKKLWPRMGDYVADQADAKVEAIDEMAKPQGRPQTALLAHMMKVGPDVAVQLPDVSALREFRGIHFAKLMKAAEVLAKKGYMTFDGVVMKLAAPTMESVCEAITRVAGFKIKVLARPGIQEASRALGATHNATMTPFAQETATFTFVNERDGRAFLSSMDRAFTEMYGHEFEWSYSLTEAKGRKAAEVFKGLSPTDVNAALLALMRHLEKIDARVMNAKQVTAASAKFLKAGGRAVKFNDEQIELITNLAMQKMLGEAAPADAPGKAFAVTVTLEGDKVSDENSDTLVTMAKSNGATGTGKGKRARFVFPNEAKGRAFIKDVEKRMGHDGFKYDLEESIEEANTSLRGDKLNDAEIVKAFAASGYKKLFVTTLKKDVDWQPLGAKEKKWRAGAEVIITRDKKWGPTVIAGDHLFQLRADEIGPFKPFKADESIDEAAPNAGGKKFAVTVSVEKGFAADGSKEMNTIRGVAKDGNGATSVGLFAKKGAKKKARFVFPDEKKGRQFIKDLEKRLGHDDWSYDLEEAAGGKFVKMVDFGENKNPRYAAVMDFGEHGKFYYKVYGETFNPRGKDLIVPVAHKGGNPGASKDWSARFAELVKTGNKWAKTVRSELALIAREARGNMQRMAEGLDEAEKADFSSPAFSGLKKVMVKVDMGGKKEAREGRSADGFLAIHPRDAGQWGVTHIPTGLAAVGDPGFNDPKQAVRFAAAMSELGDWDFKTGSAMPSDIKKGAGAILKKFKRYMKRANGSTGFFGDGNVKTFISVLVGAWTQWDQKQSAKPGHSIHALGLTLGAVDKVRQETKAIADKSDPGSLKKLKASIEKNFTVTRTRDSVLRAIDLFLKNGKPPKYPGTKGSTAKGANESLDEGAGADYWDVWSRWSPDERIVFSATVELKAGYGGNKNYRYDEAKRATGITQEQWDTARESLIKRGVFNKAGSVKPAIKKQFYDTSTKTGHGPSVSQSSPRNRFESEADARGFCSILAKDLTPQCQLMLGDECVTVENYKLTPGGAVRLQVSHDDREWGVVLGRNERVAAIIEAKKVASVPFAGGDAPPHKEGAFKINHNDLDKIAQLMSNIEPDTDTFGAGMTVLTSKMAGKLKKLRGEDPAKLAGLFGVDNIPDAQDVIAKNGKKAFFMWMRNLNKDFPETAKWIRTTGDNNQNSVILLFFAYVALISGLDMAKIVIKKHFSSIDNDAATIGKMKAAKLVTGKSKADEALDSFMATLVDEAIDQTKLLALYNRLKKGDKIVVAFKGGMSSSSGTTLVVTSPHRVVGKRKVGRILLKNVANLKGVKYTLFNQDGHVDMAIGDMGTSLTSVEMSTSEGVDEAADFYAQVSGARKSKTFKTPQELITWAKKQGFTHKGAHKARGAFASAPILQGAPKFGGLSGPMNGGDHVRYETVASSAMSPAKYDAADKIDLDEEDLAKMDIKGQTTAGARASLAKAASGALKGERTITSSGFSEYIASVGRKAIASAGTLVMLKAILTQHGLDPRSFKQKKFGITRIESFLEAATL